MKREITQPLYFRVNELDITRHLDYIHCGLVKAAADWPWSSFHRYVRKGFYGKDWRAGIGKDLPAIRGE
jgi:putative transposase